MKIIVKVFLKYLKKSQISQTNPSTRVIYDLFFPLLLNNFKFPQFTVSSCTKSLILLKFPGPLIPLHGYADKKKLCFPFMKITLSVTLSVNNLIYNEVKTF